MEEYAKPKDKRTILLIGMMGAGKSTVGFALSQRLNIKFIDTDDVIEKTEGKSMNEIFSDKGAPYLQNLEKDVIKNVLLNKQPQVVSIGGNAYDDDDNRKIIKQNSITVYLEVEYDVLLERVKRKNTRPLLEQGDKVEVFKKIFDEKTPIYKSADIIINTTYLNKETAINLILKSINDYIVENSE